ncbi:sirohydrochlorin cobaltochelatase [Sedimentibacter acidaminivorans]|uniref:Sirohydrochlorin cobaltochelatase n=1 Tax=Sedimentibacter acidaminivorans TaxID=913099 RepID=A0ABS4GEN6_9FIRM|nr:sirohydrochlorin cobaltochelatase [Sedimentibacter acidaminivorans]MBP1926168.1 sirohydrochlorin cobaltochelatase [Sedimentibacter acidaminivorans]
MKKAIINASFGCSIKESREKYIETIENKVKDKYKDVDCFRVFTSEMIRRKIKREENIEIDNMKTCLSKLKRGGYTHISILATHIIPGSEYEKILHAVEEYKNDFAEIKVSRTFLNETMGEREVDVIKSYIKIDLESDEAVVLVGHGTDHEADKYYKEFEGLLREVLNNSYMISIEGNLVLDDVIKELKEKKFRKIYLYPFLVVAGDHAMNDIASDDDDSIKSYLKKNGFEVEAFITGLGSNERAIELFVDRIR